MIQGRGRKTRATRKCTLSDQQLDRLVDAYFDRELDLEQRRRLFDELSGDGDRCEDIACMQQILAQLRRPADPIDVTADVIARVDGRRSFLPAKVRSMIRAGRMAVAASILVALLGVVVLQRIAPDATRLGLEDTPVTSLIQNSSEELSEIATSLAGASESAKRLLPLSFEADLKVVPIGVTIVRMPSEPLAPGACVSDGVFLEDHLVMSGAGGAVISNASVGGSLDSARAEIPPFADIASLRLRGIRLLERPAATMDLTTLIEARGEKADRTHYERLRTRVLPVAFDQDAWRGVVRLIVPAIDPDELYQIASPGRRP